MSFKERAIAASLSALLLTAGCGKSVDHTGDETHFQACNVDGDCANLGTAFKCQSGFCQAAAPASASGGAQSGSSGRASAAGGDATMAAAGSGGTATRSSGGTAGGGASSGGASSGGASSNGGSPAPDSGTQEPSHDAGTRAPSGYRTAITPDEVSCGNIPACQPPIIKCCSSTGSPGGGCAQTSGVCSSNISLECDGPEDCSSGVCSGEPYGGGVQTQCLPSKGTYLMCHDHTQCPGSSPNCCPIFTDQFKPYLGECDTRAVLSTGACDTPASGGSLPDASTPVVDAGPNRTPITPDEVTCGSIPACQSPTIKCCSGTPAADQGGCAPLSGVCSSNISLECDGPEDCAEGVCSGEPYGGGVQTQCKASKGTYLICHDHTQCSGATPNCCPIFTDKFKPYLRECDSRTSVSAGACDTP